MLLSLSNFQWLNNPRTGSRIFQLLKSNVNFFQIRCTPCGVQAAKLRGTLYPTHRWRRPCVNGWPMYQMGNGVDTGENFNCLSRAHERYRETTE